MINSLFTFNKGLTHDFFYFYSERVDPTEDITSTHKHAVVFWRIRVSLNTLFWAQCRSSCAWCHGLCFSGGQTGWSNGPFCTPNLWIGRANESLSRERLLLIKSLKLSSHWGNKQTLGKKKHGARHPQIVDLFWQMHFSANYGSFKQYWQMSLGIICKN